MTKKYTKDLNKIDFGDGFLWNMLKTKLKK